MTREIALPTQVGSAAAERFRRAEAALWAHHGMEPAEHFVELSQPRLRVRVLEVGSGRPFILAHGTVGPGGFASLIEALGASGRFLVIDRPGWGGTEPMNVAAADYREVSADIMRGVLDAFGIDRATVIGGSIGDTWALSLAERHPTRVDRVVLLGAGPMTDDVKVPPIIKRIASPVGALMVRVPTTTGMMRSILASSGHRVSLADGRIPDMFVAYRRSVANDTPTMHHERSMIREIVRGDGWRPGFAFDEPTLARIAPPVLLLWGTADGLGDAAIWRQFVGTMPNGALEVVPGAGHMLWFDEPRLVADRIARFADA